MSETVSKDILDGVRLLETEFKRNAINGTGGSRLAWEGRAKLARLIAKEIEIDRAEITKLKSQLETLGTQIAQHESLAHGYTDEIADLQCRVEEARVKAIEECARIAKTYGGGDCDQMIDDFRALIAGRTK